METIEFYEKQAEMMLANIRNAVLRAEQEREKYEEIRRKIELARKKLN